MNDNTCIDNLVGPKVKGGILSILGPNNYIACKRSIRGYNTLKLTKDEATEYKEFIKRYKIYFIELYITKCRQDPTLIDRLNIFPEDKHIEKLGISFIINYIKSLIQTNNNLKLVEILNNINTTIYTLLINDIDNTNNGRLNIYNLYNKPEIKTPNDFKILIDNYNNQIIPFESFETPDKIVNFFKLINKPIPKIIDYGSFILKNIKSELFVSELFNIIISSENVLNKHSYFRLAIGNNNAELNFLELYKNTKNDTFLRNNRICIYNNNEIIYDTNNHINPIIINVDSVEVSFKNEILEFNYFLQILDQYLLNPFGITEFYEGKKETITKHLEHLINDNDFITPLKEEKRLPLLYSSLKNEIDYNIFMNSDEIFKINNNLDKVIGETHREFNITNYLNTNPPNKMLISLLNILNLPFLLSTNFLSINPLDIKPIGIFSDYTTTTNILPPIEFNQVAITNFPNKDKFKIFINKHIPEYLILEPDLLSSKPIRIIKNKMCKSINFLKLSIGELEIGHIIQIVLIDFTDLENIILKTYSLILFENIDNIVEVNFTENDSIYPIYTNFLKYVHDVHEHLQNADDLAAIELPIRESSLSNSDSSKSDIFDRSRI